MRGPRSIRPDGRVRSRDLDDSSVVSRAIAPQSILLEHLHPDTIEALRRGLLADEPDSVSTNNINDTQVRYVTAPFTVAGPLEVRSYGVGLTNTVGRTLTLVRLTGRVGVAPSGSAAVIRVDVSLDPEVDPPALRLSDYEGEVGTVTIPAGQTFASTEVVIPWPVRGYLTVTTVAASGAEDLTLQVVAR